MGFSIAIDGFRLISESRGSHGVYVSELVRSLSGSSEVEAVYLLLPRRVEDDFIHNNLTHLPNVHCVCPSYEVFPEKNLACQVFWIQWVIFRLIKTKLRSIDCYIAPYHHPPILLPKRISVITVIHDLCGLRADCGYLKTKIGFYRHLFLFLMASLRSNLLMPISKYTKQQLEEHFPFLCQRISKVVYNGVNCQPVSETLLRQVLEKFAVHHRKYFLGFGSPGLRKGLDLMLGAYKLYKEHAGEAVLVLIVSGQYRKLLDGVIATQGLSDVVMVSDIESNERDALYRGALALLFPSRCEGFGYPLIEAMRQGCPPIAWKEGPAAEIVDTVLSLLSRLETTEIAQQMEAFERLGNEARLELAERLFQRSLLFTGEKFGHDFLQSVKQRIAACNRV
jgi:glycosyltransferase involved in cell wall biosynthesis